MSDATTESRLALVVDGGGTKTDGCLLRESAGIAEVLGRGRAGESNPSAIGVDRAAEAIATAAKEAIAAAPAEFRETPIERAAFALAGTLDAELRHAMQSRLAKLGIAAECRVFPDVLPIVLASSPSGEGAALIAGTGSVAVARTADGRLAVTGGWGFLLGDEGSGFAIGREAVRQTLWQLESSVPLSPLASEVQGALGASSIDGIKRTLYAGDNTRFQLASLASLTLRLAKVGDATAQTIVTSAAAQLTDLLEHGTQRLDLPEPLSVALAGGLLGAGSPLLEAILVNINERFPGAQVQLVGDPVTACQRLLSDEVFNGELNVEV